MNKRHILLLIALALFGVFASSTAWAAHTAGPRPVDVVVIPPVVPPVTSH